MNVVTFKLEKLVPIHVYPRAIPAIYGISGHKFRIEIFLTNFYAQPMADNSFEISKAVSKEFIPLNEFE